MKTRSGPVKLTRNPTGEHERASQHQRGKSTNRRRAIATGRQEDDTNQQSWVGEPGQPAPWRTPEDVTEGFKSAHLFDLDRCNRYRREVAGHTEQDDAHHQ